MTKHFYLDPIHTDSSRIKAERQKAQKLKKSSWWQNKVSLGLCHYCGQKFKPSELTMDHVMPLARGGVSAKDNLVPACKACNQSKKLSTPLDEAFKTLESQSNSSDPGETE